MPQLALERDGANTLLRRYLYGTRRISMNSGGSNFYYHYDALGSAVNLTSNSGASEWTYSYEPYGASRTTTKNDPNAPENPMQFTGEYLDAPTGLYHLRARQYDPTIGRFNRTDPVSSPDGAPRLSSYAYVADRPTVLIDPSGETFVSSAVGRGAAQQATSPAGAARSPLTLLGEGGPCSTLGYPLGKVGPIIGRPNVPGSTHDPNSPPNNWQSDNAVDISVPVGTDVCAVVAGVIDPIRIGPLDASNPRFAGLRVYILASKNEFYYAHLSRLVVVGGQHVSEGQLLGYSGSANGAPHLHFAVKHGNPLKYVE